MVGGEHRARGEAHSSAGGHLPLVRGKCVLVVRPIVYLGGFPLAKRKTTPTSDRN